MTLLAQTSSIHRPERLFTVAEYLRMMETGILTKKDKVELIEGRIVEKMGTNAPHEAALQRIHELLMRACPQDWMIRTEATLRLEKSAPEPDAIIIRGPIDRYDEFQPGADDTRLVIEIADSTLQDDRHEKAPIYASARIAFYWIVNLVDRRVEIHSNPTGPDHFPAYRNRQDIDEEGVVTLAFPEGTSIELRVKDMLPRKKLM